MATVPFADAYVEAVLPPGAVRVGPDGEPSPWLDAGYLVAHAGEVDVLHVHGGYGHVPVAALEHWTETVRRLGIPLVLTVHQLREAAHPTRTRHDAHLAALLATAEVVLTLTPGAADEIAERYGRTAIVVAHPSVTEPVPELGAERGTVGLVLRCPSPAVPDPAGVVRAALSGAVSGGGRLRVLLGVPGDPDESVPGVSGLAAEGALELVVPGADDAAWAAELQQLHVAVLAERCGTHSRDLEICRDVGTRVVAPSCGWFAGQWSDVVTYGNDERHGFDPVSLTVAVAAALARPAPRPADRAWRAEQLAAVRRVHEQVYAQVAADRAGV
ncbi:glycosyltransferase [Blastococcus sp. SYSU D00669]